ncbi:MAG: PIN domain-containing protein [Phycisphaerae bacterium]
MMTSSAAHSIDAYQFSETDALLFDANIWIYLHCPESSPPTRVVACYSGALKQILTAKSRIFIDVLILSEFVNRYARLVQQVTPKWRRKHTKKWRNSAGFKPVAKAIASACHRLLKNCQLTESGLESADITALLGSYESGRSDFNDLMLAELCRAKRLALVTHDADFKGSDITLLTANRKLLEP